MNSKLIAINAFNYLILNTLLSEFALFFSKSGELVNINSENLFDEVFG
jgi:hypothetical protein